MNISNILKSIGEFLSKLLPWAKTSIAVGTAVANEIKTIIDNQAWDVAVSFTSTKLDDEALALFRQGMAWLIVQSKWATSAIDDVDAVLKEGSATIAGMTGIAKSGALNTLAAGANVKYAELTGYTMPDETALAAQQPAYFHPELVG